MIKTALILTVFLSLSAFAGTGIFYSLDNSGKLIANDTEYNKNFSGVAAEIDKLGLNHATINIVVVPEDSNAAYDNGEIIQIPRTMVIRDFYDNHAEYKNVIETLGVFAHEYAHSIFEIYAGAAVPGYSKVKEVMSELSKLSILPLTTPMSEAEHKANIEKSRALYKQLTSDTALMKQRNLMSAHNELFADTVAVFLNGDKEIIMNALFPPSSGNYIHDRMLIKSAEARSFSIERDPETWADSEIHNFFSPLRSVIGSDLCWPVSAADKSRKLKHLITILMEDIKEQLKSGAASDVTADNKRLIEKYKTVCK